MDATQIKRNSAGSCRSKHELSIRVTREPAVPFEWSIAVRTRKSTGKKQRFEIFKRDKFTCQYCGGTPPAIVLVVDHILPVAKGGTTVQHNLITSCEACNQGKASGLLSDIPKPIELQLAQQVERHEQLKAFNVYLMKARDSDDKVAVALGKYWCDVFYPQQNFVFSANPHRSVLAFMKRLPAAKLYEAMDIAFLKFRADESRAFKYFCGCCWKMIKDGERG